MFVSGLYVKATKHCWQTPITETLNTTKFVEVTFHTDTGSSEKDFEKTTVSIVGKKQYPEQGLPEQKNLESVPQTRYFNRKLSSQEKQSTEQDNLKTYEKTPQSSPVNATAVHIASTKNKILIGIIGNISNNLKPRRYSDIENRIKNTTNLKIQIFYTLPTYRRHCFLF